MNIDERIAKCRRVDLDERRIGPRHGRGRRGVLWDGPAARAS